MTHNEEFDAVVLGSGEGGKFIAWHLAQHGARVAVIEERYVGGSCPNIACLPSKNILHSAAVAHTVAGASAFGSQVSSHAVSMHAVQARKREMVDGLIAMHRARFAKTGAELIFGRGRFVGPRVIEVTPANGPRRHVTGKHIFLDLGAFAAMPELPGLVDATPMTHVELLDRETAPRHLVILGGGYIALELAQAMRRLGSNVTIVERAERLLTREDPDIASVLTQVLLDEGIEVIIGAEIASVSGKSGASVTLHGKKNGRDLAVTGSDLLVALGKSPNTKDVGLDLAGVALTDAGYVQVNDRLETTASDIWALGDCAGTPAFTHMSFDDFRIIRDNLAGESRVTTGRQVPFCLFTEPELARVGLNEVEAASNGIAYRLAEIPAAAILRTRSTGETTGKLKLLVGEDDRILGFTALCARAGEFLPVVQLAMANGLPYQAVENLVIAHPTYSEGLNGLFASAMAQA